MSEHNAIQWPEWLNSSIAFVLAIVGWIWHAARLATKIDVLERRVEAHVSDEAKTWEENRRAHDAIVEKMSDIREDVAGIKGHLTNKE